MLSKCYSIKYLSCKPICLRFCYLHDAWARTKPALLAPHPAPHHAHGNSVLSLGCYRPINIMPCPVPLQWYTGWESCFDNELGTSHPTHRGDRPRKLKDMLWVRASCLSCEIFKLENPIPRIKSHSALSMLWKLVCLWKHVKPYIPCILGSMERTNIYHYLIYRGPGGGGVIGLCSDGACSSDLKPLTHFRGDF